MAMINIFLSAALLAALFIKWAVTPMPFPDFTSRIIDAYAIIGALVVGALYRIWIRSSMVFCIASAVGLFVGGTWIEFSISDVTIQMSYAAWYSIEIWGKMELLIFSFLIVSWFMTDHLAKKAKIRRVASS